MAPRIYIVGASAELRRAERACAMAIEAGFELVFDWPANYRREGLVADRQLAPHVRHASMLSCLRASMTAQVVWLLLPNEPTIGAWVELGAALGSALFLLKVERVITTGADPRRSIFLEGATHVGHEDESAIGYLRSRLAAEDATPRCRGCNERVGSAEDLGTCRECGANEQCGGCLQACQRCGEAELCWSCRGPKEHDCPRAEPEPCPFLMTVGHRGARRCETPLEDGYCPSCERVTGRR